MPRNFQRLFWLALPKAAEANGLTEKINLLPILVRDFWVVFGELVDGFGIFLVASGCILTALFPCF